MSEKVWYLKRCPLFERLAPADCRRMESRSRSRTFGKGEIVYFPTDAGESVLLLVRGRVKLVSLLPDGRESILAFIEPGELFGELALVDSSPRHEQAETVEASHVLVIPRDELLRAADCHPGLALSVLKLVGFRLRRVENRLRGMLFRSSRERTVSILLDLAERYGRAAGGRRDIEINLSHQELANLLGTTRETVTLTLGQLQRDGLIELNRRRIAIPDLPRLAAEAASLPPELGTTHKVKP